MQYLGDFPEDAVVHVPWHTFAADGASITRTTNGTVSVYKGNGTTQSTAGVTDTEDFDSLTGIHWVTIDTSADAFYATGNNYAVVLSGATIDGETVNAVLATFSIENRHQVDVSALATAAAVAGVETKVDSIDGNVDAIKATTDVNLDAPVSSRTAGGTYSAPPSVAAIRAEMDSNSTQLAAIVADTNELQTDWVNGGRLDTILDARASQTSVDDLPTNAELTTALGTADDAMIAMLTTLDTNVDTLITHLASNRSEPSAGAPAASATLGQKVDWLYAMARNKQVTTATERTLYADDGSTALAESTHSDASDTLTRNEWGAP